MIKNTFTCTLLSAVLFLPTISHAEMLSMMNYESKPGQLPRKEGIAIIDVDPTSPSLGKSFKIYLSHPMQWRIIFFTIKISAKRISPR